MNSFVFNTIDESKVREEMDNFVNRKALCADNLKTETLKQMTSYILSLFTYILNQGVDENIYLNAFILNPCLQMWG